MRGRACFRPHERLLTPAAFLHVKSAGKRRRTPHFGVSSVTNELPYHRLGLVVQKKFWHAVVRNRIKRCLREWFRLSKHLIPLPGKDIVIIAYPGAERLSPKDIAREISIALGCQDSPLP